MTLNPSHYRILAIGKLRKDWIQLSLNSYLKRLPGLAITELRDSTPQKESTAILTTLKRNEIAIALTEEGESLTSIAFAKRLQALGSQRLVFMIGGANGLTPQTKSLASWSFSLSPLTFPHEIARLLLVEQIYRAHTILQGSPYHRS